MSLHSGETGNGLGGDQAQTEAEFKQGAQISRADGWQNEEAEHIERHRQDLYLLLPE